MAGGAGFSSGADVSAAPETGRALRWLTLSGKP